jgi:hypothetical protein
MLRELVEVMKRDADLLSNRVLDLHLLGEMAESREELLGRSMDAEFRTGDAVGSVSAGDAYIRAVLSADALLTQLRRPRSDRSKRLGR